MGGVVASPPANPPQTSADLLASLKRIYEEQGQKKKKDKKNRRRQMYSTSSSDSDTEGENDQGDLQGWA